MKFVSVIIPTKNRSALLKEAIESVLAVQRNNFDLEVIVVDDGSTDETAAVIARYPVIHLRTNRVGAAGARNAGIIAAHGEYLAFLDDDDLWLPTNVTPQLDMLTANAAYGAVHAQVLLTRPDRTSWGQALPAGPLTCGWIFYDLLTYWPQSASVVIRRSVLQEVGLFDTSLSNAEDWDLMLRIAKRYPIGRVEQPVALFLQRDDKDEGYVRRCVPTMAKVFRRHTCAETPLTWLTLQPALWRRHGWFASRLVSLAQAHAQDYEYKRAWRSLTYAFGVSPLHALLRAPGFWSTLAVVAPSRFQTSQRSPSVR